MFSRSSFSQDGKALPLILSLQRTLQDPASVLAPEYQEFDFWIGDWDVFDVDSPTTRVARIRVDRILDGCVLREDYQDTHGLNGQSFSIYDGVVPWGCLLRTPLPSI